MGFKTATIVYFAQNVIWAGFGKESSLEWLYWRLTIRFLSTKSLQLCLTLWDPMDCSPPSSSVCRWDSPGKNTGLDCQPLLQGRSHLYREQIGAGWQLSCFFWSPWASPHSIVVGLQEWVCVCVCVCVRTCDHLYHIPHFITSPGASLLPYSSSWDSHKDPLGFDLLGVKERELKTSPLDGRVMKF